MYHSILLLQSITIPVYQQQEAVWWFIPIIAYAALAGGGAAIVVGTLISWFCGEPEPEKGKTIAVLGMQGAGKTQFLANIRNKDYKEYAATIGSEDYEKFNICLGNRLLSIEGGNDIGGGEELILDYYEDMIKNKEIVFFLFNAYKYINEEKYRKQTQYRLEFINRHSLDSKCTVNVFATFADRFSNDDERKKAYTSIKQSVLGKDYSRLFIPSRFFMQDMRNKKLLMEKLEKIFS